jgi:outer membrane protein TolC
VKKLQRIAAGAMALRLAGCAVPDPAPTAAADAPRQWYAPLPHNGTLAELASWWQQFDDPLLVELIESAQAASPTVQAGLQTA